MVKNVSVKDKLKKIKNSSIWKLPDDEKVGVVNGLVLLGTISGALFSLHAAKEVHASAQECDANTGELTKSGIDAHNYGFDYSEWGNHCWWDHSWHDHSWWDHSWDNSPPPP